MKPLRSIFAIVADCHAEVGHYREIWRQHFYEGLRSVVDRLEVPRNADFTWARGALPPAEQARPRAETSDRLAREIDAAREAGGVDAVISYCFGGDLEPGLIQETIRRGTPWINFYCDSTHRFPEVQAIAEIVTLNWFPENDAIESYRRLGPSWLCRPYALNPRRLPESGCRDGDIHAAFIGLPTANRITQLGLLRLRGQRVAIRGHGWVGENLRPFHNPQRQAKDWLSVWLRRGLGEKLLRRALWPLVRRQAARAIPAAEMPEYLSRCQVVLGLNQGRDERGRFASYLKLRDVEFPGYGCCYLTEHNRDVEGAFEVGREILTYRSVGEAAARLREMKRSPEQARAIGQAGRKRVLEEHTWERRLAELAARLG